MEAKVSFTTFGELLKHLRQRAQMTQDEFGLAVGYSRAHIARLESNQRLPDAGAVKARFFEPLDLKPDSDEAILLVKLANSARAMPASFVEEHEAAPAPTIPNNLPYELTSFIGREGALSELERLLLATRLLTLTGTGGTGKTRLALKLAERVMGDYPDGVWLIELAPLSDPAMVPQAILAALGRPDVPAQQATSTLIHWLREKRILLLIDNCEHVIDACAQVIDALLRGCRNITVLTTSREALGIPGELAWRVPSLQVPDAKSPLALEVINQYESVRLFVERATFVQPAFALKAENAPAVLHICKRLDGIPLAIELAAARIATYGPEVISKRLDESFRLLAGGSRIALPRQQTLQAAVEWSYRLLNEQEKLLLCRLSVFVGGWTLEAGEFVGQGDDIEQDQIFDLLGRLVNKSLVAVDDAGIETRYFLLETIRQYAIEKLNAGDEAKAMRDRHLDYFLVLQNQIFDELNGIKAQHQVRWVKRLNPDFENIRLAMRWSIDTNQIEKAYSLFRGFYGLIFSSSQNHEMADWMRLIAFDQAMNDHTRADALMLIALIYRSVGNFNEAQSVNEQIISMGISLNDSRIVARGLFGLMWDAIFRMQLSEARAHLDRFEAMTTHANFDPHWDFRMNCTEGKAMLALLEGRYSDAVIGNTIVHTYLKQDGNKIASTNVARRLGYALLLSGDATSALTFFRESLLDNYALNDVLALSACLFAFGVVAEKSGDDHRAACLFAAATKTMHSAGRQNFPWDIRLYEPSVAAVRTHLDQLELAAMWAKGEAMTLEQAMAYALEMA